MLSSVRKKIGLSYSRLYFRHEHKRIINFTDAMTRARKMLIIFPETLSDCESTISFFQHLIWKYSSEGMQIIIRDDLLSSMASAPPMKTITYTDNDITPWFIPKKKLIHKIKKNTYDIALDLNVGFSLTSAFLCRASKATYRIGFSKNNGDSFYNFQINSKKHTSNNHLYKSLIKCLDMF